MSEGELHVPRLGRLAAAPGFRLVAAMNPFDAIGTARISGAVYDRVCRLAVDYQTATDERQITERAAGVGDLDPELGRQGGRARSSHAFPRRSARRFVGPRGDRHVHRRVIARRLFAIRRLPRATCRSMRRSLRSSGRIRLHEGTTRSTEASFVELWLDVFGRKDDDGSSTGRLGRPERGDERRPTERPASGQGGRRGRRGGHQGTSQDHVAPLARAATAFRRDLARGRCPRR